MGVKRAIVHLGTAGWAIPQPAKDAFPPDGSHLVRYASRLPAVEINSTFRQWHRSETFARWAASVPDAFRFALKVPQAITHEAGLVGCEELVARFIDETAALGAKRGPLLIQLPPALEFSSPAGGKFFKLLRRQYHGPVVCEPRHPSWSKPAVDRLLASYEIARVAADPPPIPEFGIPGGWQHLAYYRWHGRERIYYSSYDASELRELASRLTASAENCETWCIFDNTALGFAATNALEMAQLLESPDSNA